MPRRIIFFALVLCLGPGAVPSVLAHPGLDEQLVALTAEIEADPLDGTLYLRRGEVHRVHGSWEEAERDYRRARQLDPQLTIVGLCLAKLKLESGEPRRALKLIDAYLDEQGEGMEARVVRARALAGLGRHLEAAAEFTRALRAGGTPPAPDYYLERAQALVAAGAEYVAEAIVGLDEGIAQHGFAASLQTHALELERKSGRVEDALRRVDGILARAQRGERWLVLRGELLEAAGRPEEALVAYRDSLQAIAALPASRRSARAVRDLLAEAEAAVKRLDAQQ